MAAGLLIRNARTRAGLSLRELAEAAATSHSTIAAYEQSRVDPTSDTVERIVRAAGFDVETALVRRCRGTSALSKGDELIAALDLAAQFPARPRTNDPLPVFPGR